LAAYVCFCEGGYEVAGYAKVTEFDVAFGVGEDVCWFDVCKNNVSSNEQTGEVGLGYLDE
jgi:hypothetical protein